MEKNKPQIRFKGFEKVWNEKKLFNLADFSKGKGFSKNDLTEKGTPIILYGRLYTNYQTIIKNVETFVEAKDINVFSKGGEVIVPASGETQEDIVRASVVENEKIILGGDLNIIIPNNKLESIFLALTISNGKVYKELVKKAQGKSVVHIRNNDLKEALIPFPDKSEQQKIGTFFENLDKLITEHQQKHSKLKTLKKAMLSKMFPQQGQTVPEIRFKGFSGDWEEKSFEKLGDFSKGNGLSKNDVSYSGKYNCVLYGHLYTEYGMIIRKIEYSTDKELNNKVLSQFGDILIPSSDTTPTGLARATCIEKDNVILGGDINIFTPNDLIIGRFLSFYINAKREKMIPLIKGTTVKHIYNSDLKNLKILYPNKEEQRKIGEYFINIDELIHSHNKQILKLQNIKKAFLAKMFV